MQHQTVDYFYYQWCEHGQGEERPQTVIKLVEGPFLVTCAIRVGGFRRAAVCQTAGLRAIETERGTLGGLGPCGWQVELAEGGRDEEERELNS